MSTLLAIPNGQILLTILVVGVLGLALTSVGALLGIWTWNTPKSIIVLVMGVILFFFVASFALGEEILG